MRQTVENLIQTKYGPIEDSVKAQLAEITRKCQENVFLSFRKSQLGSLDNQDEVLSGENSLPCQQSRNLEPIFAPPPPISDEWIQPTIQEVEMSLSQGHGAAVMNSSDSGYSSLERIQNPSIADEFFDFDKLEVEGDFLQTNRHSNGW